MRTIVMAASIFLAAGLASAAKAQTPEEPASDVATVTVSYADISIDDPGGARVLDHRLRSAARRLCDEPNRVITHYRVQHLCVKEAVAEAWRQVAVRRSTQTAEGRTITFAVIRTTQQR